MRTFIIAAAVSAVTLSQPSVNFDQEFNEGEKLVQAEADGLFKAMVHHAKVVKRRRERKAMIKAGLRAVGLEQEDVEVPTVPEDELAEIAEGEGNFWDKIKHAASKGASFAWHHRRELGHLAKVAAHELPQEEEDVEVPTVPEDILSEIAEGEGSFWSKIKHAASSGAKFAWHHRQELAHLAKEAASHM